MKKLFVVLLAVCASVLSAQPQIQTESSEVQTELRKIHSTLRALQRAEASQKKTFNILATRVDSLKTVLHQTQAQAQQTNDSLTAYAKAQTAQAARLDAFQSSLDSRSAIVILAIVVVAGLSLVIFFTLKKTIGESSDLVLAQVLKQVQASEAKKQGVSALVVETPQKKASITLPIQPELFTPAAPETPAAPPTPAAKPELHVAIAEMISAPERTAAKDEAPAPSASSRAAASKQPLQCQGVTKSGARCKRKAVAGTHFCTQHTA